MNELNKIYKLANNNIEEFAKLILTDIIYVEGNIYTLDKMQGDKLIITIEDNTITSYKYI